MKRSNSLIWFRRLVVLGAVVAGLTASAAGAVPMYEPGDTPTNPVVGNTTPLGLRADGLRWQAIAKAYQQNGKTDVSHSTAQWLPAPGLRWQAIAKARQTNVSHSTALGRRADGLRWQAIAKAYQENEQAPPDVVERYVATHAYTARYVPAATSGNSGLRLGRLRDRGRRDARPRVARDRPRRRRGRNAPSGRQARHVLKVRCRPSRPNGPPCGARSLCARSGPPHRVPA